MKLTLLGTSNYHLDYPLGSAGYVVEAGDTTLKLDFGHGNLLRLAEAGIDWRALDAVLLSHIHPDHISDLVKYFQAYTLSHSRTQDRTAKPLQLFAPAGIEEFMEQFTQLVDAPWQDVPLQIEAVTATTFHINDVTIQTASVKHSLPCTGYRVEYQDKVLVYSGDTAYCPSLVELATDADLLLIECDAASDVPESDGHMRPQDVARVANEAGVKRIVLTHYPGDPRVREERRSQVAAACNVEVIAGQDSMVLDI